MILRNKPIRGGKQENNRISDVSCGFSNKCVGVLKDSSENKPSIEMKTSQTRSQPMNNLSLPIKKSDLFSSRLSVAGTASLFNLMFMLRSCCLKLNFKQVQVV